jgi:hypothetical protein
LANITGGIGVFVTATVNRLLSPGTRADSDGQTEAQSQKLAHVEYEVKTSKLEHDWTPVRRGSASIKTTLNQKKRTAEAVL